VESKHAEMQRMLERLRDTAESWFSLSPGERERERTSLNAFPVHDSATGAAP
jgi:hypothetical protein